MSPLELTDDQKKLLYLISQFSNIGRNLEDPDVWLKELALRTFIFQGIIDQVFTGYDYAPLSVDTVNGRMFFNISQEAEDDIVDLRQLDLVECLKLISQSSKMISAYRVTKKGFKIGIPEEYMRKMDKIIRCNQCNELLSVRYEKNPQDNIYLMCKSCNSRTDSDITTIEDISYSSKPYFPKFPFYINYARRDEKYGYLQIDDKKTIKIFLRAKERNDDKEPEEWRLQ